MSLTGICHARLSSLQNQEMSLTRKSHDREMSSAGKSLNRERSGGGMSLAGECPWRGNVWRGKVRRGNVLNREKSGQGKSGGEMSDRGNVPYRQGNKRPSRAGKLKVCFDFLSRSNMIGS